jgi:hypothetical protein
MPERKSPPGPRETIQELPSVLHSQTGIGFISEGEAISEENCEWLAFPPRDEGQSEE